MSDEEEARELTPEQIRKVEAEARKIEDDNSRAAALHDLTLEKNQVEIDKLKTELDKAKLDTFNAQLAVGAAQINFDQMKRQEEAALATDLFHQIYYFNDDVGERSVKNCMDRLTYWARVKPGSDIEVVFSSPGGSVFDGLQLFDFIQTIRRQGHRVTTSALGMAASMAGILLQAGSERVMAKESWLLIHEISTIAFGKASDIEDEAKFLKRIQARTIDIFMEGVVRATQAGTATKPMTRSKFADSWSRKDWWLSSDEALAAGFVDSIR